MPSKIQVTELEVALAGLAPHSHLCLLYENESEQLTLATHFIRLGLRLGERCIYIHDEGMEAHWRRALGEAGIEVEQALAAGALLLLTPAQAYLKGNAFDAYRMTVFWKKQAELARADGFSALRGVGDTQWIANGAPSTDQWFEYEERLTQVAAEAGCTLLCQYNRDLFPDEFVANVIRVHPTVVHRGCVCSNAYYVPPDEMRQLDANMRDSELMLRDITKRAQLERTLQENQMRLRVALESSSVPFTILQAVRDDSGRILDFAWTYLNPAAARAIGRSSQDLVGRRVLDVLPGSWDPPGLLQMYVNTVERHQPHEFEFYSSANGIFGWFHVTASPLDDAVAVWFPNITRRKRVEAELRRSEAYMLEAERISHTGSWAVYVAGQQVFWSQEVFRIFGLDPASEPPSYDVIFEMVHPEDRPRVLQAFEHVFRERTPYDQEFRVVRPNGVIRHVHSLAHPVFDDFNQLTEFVGSIVDITERRRAEDALRSTQAELARVSRVLTMGELTASIAHEVIQPLASLIANGSATLRWLAGDDPNLDEGRRGVARMIEDGRRANEVIARIRDLARKSDRRREQVDVTEAIREVLALMTGELAQNQVIVRTQLEEGLGRVVGDRVQLQQVMLNLMINAVEAVTPKLDATRDILIGAHHEEPRQIHVTVRDSGIGFGPDQAEVIFRSFYTTKPDGMGIGLSISRSIIEAHSGRLWAERNEPETGTTFHFMLPLAAMP